MHWADNMGIKLFVTDFDGCLTDNSVYVSEDGKESVRCSRADGIGLNMLKEAGMQVLVISQEQNPVVTKRCEKLAVPCLQNITEKLTMLEAYCGFDLEFVAFFGNDLPDLGCLQAVGLPGCPSDAQPQVLAYCAAHGYITEARGGEGAVREFCEYILNGAPDEIDICLHEGDKENLTTMEDKEHRERCRECGEILTRPFKED